MREEFVMHAEFGKRATVCLTTGVVALAMSVLSNAYGQAFDCATWGDEETQLVQLTVGESKTFQLPTASLDPNGASCVDDVDEIQYEVRRSSDPVLPDGFTFDEEDVTITGCSTDVLSSHKFSLVATGPSNCSCTPASLEVVFRIKDDDDEASDAMCTTTGTAPIEDTVALDQTPPTAPFYGWSQVNLGGRWTQPAGLDESEQGAALTYGARCTGEYDLEENYVGGCPAFLSFIEQSKYDNGIVYFTEQISEKRSDIGIYRIRITAHKEDVAATSQTTVVLEVVDDHPKPDSLAITAPALNTLRLVWEVDEDERDYITGFDLEFRKVLGGESTQLFELANSVTSLTLGSLDTDTQYQARLRIRGGQWSDWAQADTLGNNAPTFKKTGYSFKLTENVSGEDERIRLGQVEATDPNPQDEVTYSLEASDTRNFSIGASSGILYYIGDGEDHEATPTINVQITASGGIGARKLESTVIATIEVTNVSEPLAFAPDAQINIRDLTVGDIVDMQLPLAMGGDGAISYSVDPELPNNLSVGTRTGKLTGIPAVTTKRITYSYIATDVEGETDTLSFTLRIFGKAPKAPTSLTVQRAHADRITILWENPSTPFVTVITHEIEHRVKGTSRWKREQIDAPATKYTITGLTRNTKYQIRVKNIASSGHVGFSSILEAETRPYATPSVPRNVSLVEAGTESLSLEWDKPADSGGRNIAVYDVRYRKKGTDMWTEVESRDTSITLTGLEQGTEYLVGVRAVNVAGTGPWSADLTASTIRNSRPIFEAGASIPNQSYKVGETISTVQLPSASEGDGDLIYSLLPALPEGIQFDLTTLTLSGTPTETLTATTYTFTVKDSDEFVEDDESFLTFEMTVAANTPLSPSLVVEDIGYETAVVAWMMPDARGSAITSFDLEIRETDQTNEVTQHTSTATNFELTNLLPQTAYQLRIRAINAIGPSDWSMWTEFTTSKVPVEIRSRPLLHALGVIGSMLGEGAVERIGNRANPIDASQRNPDDGYVPPYYLKGNQFINTTYLDGQIPNYQPRLGKRLPESSDSQIVPLLARSIAYTLNNSSQSSGDDVGLHWSVWASFDTTRRDANAMDVLNNEEIISPLEAQTSALWIGVEFEATDDVRVGVAVSQANGEVDIDRIENGSTNNQEKDNVDFSITSAFPYVVGTLDEQLKVWGTFGRGSGSTTLTDRWGEISDLGLTANVFAAGLSFNFNKEGTSGFTLKGDLFQSNLDTDEDDVFDGALSSSVRRLRVGMQGRKYYSAMDIDLVLSGEFLGRFEDGGVADGTNIDIGGQVDIFLDEHWSIGGQLRAVRSMEADAYQALGFQFDVRRESSDDGSGLNLQFSPSWGSSSIFDDNLGHKLPIAYLQRRTNTGLRSELELSYGVLTNRHGLFEPYGTISRSDLKSQLTLGFRMRAASLGIGRRLDFDISSFVADATITAQRGILVEGRLKF